MQKHWLPILIISLSGLSTPAHAARIFVADTLGSGVNAGELETSKALIRTAVSELGQVLTEIAAEADFSLHPHLLRLGHALVLGVEKIKKGRVVFSTQLKAQEIEELDKVALRVTQAAIEERAAGKNPQVGEMTNQEASDGTQRRPARKVWYLGLGGSSLSHLGSSGVAFNVAGAYNWDLNQFLLQILADLNLRGPALFGSVGLGGHYLFSQGDVSPFLSADFGYGVSKVDRGIFGGASDAGFVVALGTGLHLLHTASTSIELACRFAWLLRSNNLGTPGVTELRLGLYF